MTEDEKSQEDEKLLLSYLTEQVTVLRLMKDDIHVQDAFLRSVDELLSEPNASTAVGVAISAQVFLDVYHAMRPNLRKMKDLAAWRISRLELDATMYSMIHHKLRSGNYSKEYDDYIGHLPIEAARFFTDHTKTVRQAHAGEGYDEPSEYNPFLSMSPVMSGTLYFYYREKFRKLGIEIARAWSSIVHVTHLYNALKQEGLLECKWVDLDMFLSVDKEDSVFFLGLPPGGRTIPGIWPGRSASRLSKAGANDIQCLSPVRDIFLPQYLDKQGQIHWTKQQTNVVLSCALYRDGQKPPYRKAVDGGRMPAHEFVKLVSGELHAESIITSFPYLLLHCQCVTFILHSVQSCNQELVDMHGQYLSSPQTYAIAIELILMDYSGTPDKPGRDQLLRMAADGANKLLAQGHGTVASRDWQMRLESEPDVNYEAWPEKSTWEARRKGLMMTDDV